MGIKRLMVLLLETLCIVLFIQVKAVGIVCIPGVAVLKRMDGLFKEGCYEKFKNSDI